MLTDNAAPGTQTIPLGGTGKSQAQMALLTIGPNGSPQVTWLPNANSPSNPTVSGIWTDTYHQTFIVGLAEFVPGTCTEISQGNMTLAKDLLGGKFSIVVKQFMLPNNQCPGQLFTFSTAYYTWGSDQGQAALQDPFSLHWTTPDGKFDEMINSNAEYTHIAVTKATPTGGGSNPPITATASLSNPPASAISYAWTITGGDGAVVFPNGQETISSTTSSVPIQEPHPTATGTSFNLKVDVTYALKVGTGKLTYGPTPAVFCGLPTAVTITASDGDNPSNQGNPLLKVAGDNESSYPVAFQANVIPQNCPDLVFDWNFGDGIQVTNAGSDTRHSFAKAGVFTATVTARCTACQTRLSATMVVGIANSEDVDITVHPSANIHGGASFPDIDFDTSGTNGDPTHNVTNHLLPVGVNSMDLECLTTPSTNDPTFGNQIQELVQWNIQNSGGGGQRPTLTGNGKFATLAADQKGLWAVSCYLDANHNQSMDVSDSKSNPFNVDLVATSITQIQTNDNQLLTQTNCAGVCVSSGAFDPTNLQTAAFWAQLNITVDDGGAGLVTVPNFNYTFAQNMVNDTFTSTYQTGRSISEVMVSPPFAYPNSLICTGDISFAPWPVLDDGGNTQQGYAIGGDTVTQTAQQDENDISATQRVLRFVDSPGVGEPTPDPCATGQIDMTGMSGYNQFSFYLLAYSDEFDTAYAATSQVNSRVTFAGTVNGNTWVSNGANSTIISRFTGSPYPIDAGVAGIDVYGPSDVGGMPWQALRHDGRN